MRILALATIIALFTACADNKNPDQPASDELRSVEGTERHNVKKSDTTTKTNSNERSNVSPEPPSKHGL